MASWLDGEVIVKKIVLAAGVLSGLALSSGAAEAKGCIKGALVGGVVGHFAGRHGTLGAAAGCLVGRHRANTRDRQRGADLRLR